MDNVANQLKGPMNAALTSIIASPTARFAAEKLLETDPAKEPGDATCGRFMPACCRRTNSQALNQLKKLDAQVYSDAFQSTGSRRTQQEVQNLKGGISPPLLNFNQSPDAYMGMDSSTISRTICTRPWRTPMLARRGVWMRVPDTIKWDMSDPKRSRSLRSISAYLPNGDRYAGKGGRPVG